MNGFIESNYCSLMIRFLIFRIISPILLMLSYVSLLASCIIFWDILIPESMKDLWVWIQVHRFLMILIMINSTFNLTLCFWTKPGSPATNSKEYILSSKEISLMFSNVKPGNHNCNNNNNNNNNNSSSSSSSSSNNNNNNNNTSSISTSSITTSSSLYTSSSYNNNINNSIGRIIDNRFQLFIKTGVYYEYCPCCHVMRPPRAKHCHILNKCIYHYEYYSPWVYNSIGINNYRYYLLWLLWMCIGSWYAAFLTGILISNMPDEWINIAIEFMFQPNLPFIIFFFGIITTICAVIFTCLLSYHIKLVYSNKTSSEYFDTGTQGTLTLLESISPILARLCKYKPNTNNIKSNYNNYNNINISKNPFDCGWRKNIKRILGDDTSSIIKVVLQYIVPTFSPPPQPEYQPSMTLEQVSYALKNDCSDILCDNTYGKRNSYSHW